jgi:hypothetical protein
MWIVLLWQHLWFGCSGSSTNDWVSVDDCSTLQKGQIRDDCYGQFLIDVFKQDANRGLRIIQEEISEPNVRDFLYLEVTRKVDPTTTRYCQLIQSTTLAKRCTTLVSRPHLHRETLRGSQPTRSPQRKPQ